MHRLTWSFLVSTFSTPTEPYFGYQDQDLFLAQGLVALRTGLPLAGYRSVGIVVLDSPFLSNERAGESCHLPPLSPLGGGCLLSQYPLLLGCLCCLLQKIKKKNVKNKNALDRVF